MAQEPLETAEDILAIDLCEWSASRVLVKEICR